MTGTKGREGERPPRPVMNFSYKGDSFRTRMDLARHLARLVSRKPAALERMLIRYGDDATEVMRHYQLLKYGPASLAREIAPCVGRRVHALRKC
jgi:hypothetical protein